MNNKIKLISVSKQWDKNNKFLFERREILYTNILSKEQTILVFCILKNEF